MSEDASKKNNSFIHRMVTERDPNKRRVKPAANSIDLMQLTGGDDSSDDSDFDIGKHTGMQSNDSDVDDSSDHFDEEDTDDSDDDDEDDSVEEKPKVSIKKEPKDRIGTDDFSSSKNESEKLICSVCLGDISTSNDEIVTCDSCGVAVHEGCYGISDTDTVVSTHSSCSTEPWFCDSCKAGVMNPVCEICPNSGGLFKETDVGRWVHIVCALYTPGIAFSSVEKLDKVTLFEIKYNRWGLRTCSLCEDESMSRTGVCMKCDAGLCNTYFHATCAQRQGLLLEASTQEIADPFFANCHLHGDKNLIPRKRKNWLILQSRPPKKPLEDPKAQARIERKLEWFREKYRAGHLTKPAPWVPTQKLPRMLNTSASACRKLKRKAELMGISGVHQTSGLIPDIARRWYVPPAFSAEYISYCLDRDQRVNDLKERLQKTLTEHENLLEEEKTWRDKYESLAKENSDFIKKTEEAMIATQKLGETIVALGGQFDGVPTCPKGGIKVELLKNVHLLRNNSETAGENNEDEDASTSDVAKCAKCGKEESAVDEESIVKCSGQCSSYYHFDCITMTKVLNRHYCPPCDEKRIQINMRKKGRNKRGEVADYKKKRRSSTKKDPIVSIRRR